MRIAIVSTPRTGSTWLHNLLVEYLKDCPGDFAAFGEYFGVDRLIAAYIPDRTKHFGWQSVFIDSSRHPERYQNDFYWDGKYIYPIFKLVTPETLREMKTTFEPHGGAAYLTEISKKRLEWLKKDPRENILIKIHAGDFQFNPELIQYLAESFKVIFLNREDRTRQILSWCTSRGTGDWGPSKFWKDRAKKKSIMCRGGWFHYIAHQLKTYEELRGQVNFGKNVVEISYEKLTKLQNPNKILDYIGIPTTKKNWDELVYGYSDEELDVDHLSLFSNALDLERWIAELDFSKIKTPRVNLILEPKPGEVPTQGPKV